VRPLKGLRIAPYYGCMIVRPEFGSPQNGNGHSGNGAKNFDNTEYPTTLDKLLKRLGAEVIDFPMKAHCCGGHMTQISESTGFELIRRLIKGASDYQADLIVTLCPMCQLNLDGFQGAMNNSFKTDYRMPVLYFTQMIGLAMGLEAEALGIGQELVSARPALAKIGVEVPQDSEAQKKKRPPKEALPMPSMPEEN
jgi:heterodisulfide reductase subunit B